MTERATRRRIERMERIIRQIYGKEGVSADSLAWMQEADLVELHMARRNVAVAAYNRIIKQSQLPLFAGDESGWPAIDILSDVTEWAASDLAEELDEAGALEILSKLANTVKLTS